MMRFFKKIFVSFVLLIVVIIFTVLAINFYINSQSKSYIFQDINDLPEKEIALVLGAKVYEQGIMSGMFQDRVETAFDLYEEKKIKKILISGDHGRENYDEVNTAKDYLLDKGVNENDIFLDHAGFDTYDSLYRAKEIFEVSSVIVVTQNFHLPRAVYIGRKLDLDIYGLSADKHLYANIDHNESREVLAKVKAFFDINFHIKPKFLGEKIPISGDSKKSWDEKSLSAEDCEEKACDSLESSEKRLQRGESEKVLNIKEEKGSKEIIEEKDVLFEVPFISQAPYGNWDDARKQDGCEEATAIMAMAWVGGEKLTLEIADEKINKISAYEKKEYGNFYDTNAEDTVERIFKGYFEYDNVEAVLDINKEDIKKELFKGNLVIVPTNGQKLNNPNYTPPGPTTHNLVIIGYDIDLKEFITNDPGTRNGEKYRYDEDVLENALFDYPTGNHKEIKEIRTAMIVVKLAF
ncbi:MAG: ElyC/SanA/YdcF family protein [Patescibacteria group bacterium]|nr:ElyC/SanA/YdcF family protein [Patescibacteria group bacterium]